MWYGISGAVSNFRTRFSNQLSSRFKDAYIINDLTIITNSENYWDWVDDWFPKKKEYHQLMRRIRYVIKMYHDHQNKLNIELWYYHGIRDLKEKSKLQFQKIKDWMLDPVTNDSEPELTMLAQDILSEIQNRQFNHKQIKKVAVSSTDQSDSNDNPNQVGD